MTSGVSTPSPSPAAESAWEAWGPSWEFQEAHRVGEVGALDTQMKPRPPSWPPGMCREGRFLGSLAPGGRLSMESRLRARQGPRFILTSVCSNKHKVFIF